MAAYSMIEPNAVYPQEDGKNELDVMFSVARMTADEMWRTRLGERVPSVGREEGDCTGRATPLHARGRVTARAYKGVLRRVVKGWCWGC